MTQFNYQHLTKELLEETIGEIFRNSDSSTSYRWIQFREWEMMNLAYPKTPSESFENKSTETMIKNELDIQITDRSNAYGNSRIYRYRINGESVLRFDQIPYPECCGIAIIKNFSANGDMSKADFLDTMDGFIKDMQKNDRFSKVLFYTNAGSNGDRLFSQIPDVIVLDPFKNRRSGNTLVGFEIDLLEKSSREGWHSLDLGEDDFDEETDGEHEEEEDDDPFGLRGILLPDEVRLLNSDNPTGINRSSDNS